MIFYKGPIQGRILSFETDDKNPEYFCCEQMKIHLSEKEKIMCYIASAREYAIRVSDVIRQRIVYCPWCGNNLPCSLREMKYDLMEEVENKDPSSDLSEFETDEWWKKRNL